LRPNDGLEPVAEPETSQPAGQSDRAGKRPWEGSGPGGFSWKAIVLAALAVYALLLIIQNSKTVTVDFVFVSRETRVIYLVVLSMALGGLIMWLVTRRRHRGERKPSTSASEQPAKKPWQGSGPGGLSWKAIGLAALGIYALLLVILNSKTVSIDFVFATRQTRVIWLVLLCMGLGALIVWLIPRIRQRRKTEQSSAPVSPHTEAPTSGADIHSAKKT
jgi:uncharacterized integral membrane protein